MGHPDGKSAPKSTWQPALPTLCRKVLPENCRKGPPGEPRVLPHQVWERGGGRAAVGLAGGPPEQAAPPAYRGPVRPDLPLAADLELAGAGGLGLLQVLAAVGLHRQAAVGVHLATQNLAVLHAQAAGLAALGPLPDVPASAGRREREDHHFSQQEGSISHGSWPSQCTQKHQNHWLQVTPSLKQCLAACLHPQASVKDGTLFHTLFISD